MGLGFLTEQKDFFSFDFAIYKVITDRK